MCLIDNNECFGPLDRDHITTRGAGGKDENNVWILCRKHHTERHKVGIFYFIKKYNLKTWLIKNKREDIIDKMNFKSEFN